MMILIIFYIFSLVMHELSHCVMAKIVYKEYDEMRIGNLIYFNITNKVKISPIILSGYVSVDEDKIINSSKKNAVIFFMSGPICNIFLVIISSVLLMFNGIFIYSIYINICLFVFSMLPINGTDFYEMLKVLQYKYKYDNL